VFRYARRMHRRARKIRSRRRRRSRRSRRRSRRSRRRSRRGRRGRRWSRFAGFGASPFGNFGYGNSAYMNHPAFNPLHPLNAAVNPFHSANAYAALGAMGAAAGTANSYNVAASNPITDPMAAAHALASGVIHYDNFGMRFFGAPGATAGTAATVGGGVAPHPFALNPFAHPAYNPYAHPAFNPAHPAFNPAAAFNPSAFNTAGLGNVYGAGSTVVPPVVRPAQYMPPKLLHAGAVITPILSPHLVGKDLGPGFGGMVPATSFIQKEVDESKH
jgi:hypothetical protein